MLRILLMGFLGLHLGGCAYSKMSGHASGEVLVDKIWDVKAQRFIGRDTLAAKLAVSDYILLGETHDNLQHHKNQAWVVEELVRRGFKPVVALEMVDESQAKKIAGKNYKSVDTFIKDLNTVKTGWEYQTLYKELFERLLAVNVALYGANLDRDTVIDIVRKGESQAPDDIKGQLQDNPLDEATKVAMRKEIIDTHCGMANDDMVAGMTLGQRVRDAAMALAMRRHKVENQPAVLIAGSGHARTDRGVPAYLNRSEPSALSTSVAWLEVDEEVAEVAAYAKPWGVAELPFDYIWFTPRTEREDPCERMRRFMHSKHKQAASAAETGDN